MKRMSGFMVATVMFLVLLISGCGGGGGDSSSAAPSAPTGVTAAAGHGEATINWTAVAGATSYNIYYSTTTGVTKTTGTKVPNATSPRIVTPLTNGTTYYFVVTAVNANGESVESSQVSALPTPNPPPPAPTGVQATPASGQATISWLPVTDATSYNIYYSITSGVTKATGTKIPNVTSPRIVTPLTNGTTYYFVVTAVNANGESTESSQVSALPTPNPPPPAPTGVQAAAASGQATINWTVVAGATSYNIYYSSTAGVTKTTGTKIPNVTSPRIVTPLTNGTTWYFVVTAQNADGESVESSQVSSLFNNPPGTPTSVTATAGFGEATIGWSAVTGATSYNIYYSTTSGVNKTTGTKITGATSPKIVTGLIRGTPYFFVVTAQNADGESSESSQVSAVPEPPDPTFSQADLAGTWNIRVILSGANPGWYSVKASVNSAGVVSVLGTGGPATPHVIPALSMTSGTGAFAGVATETGAGSEPTFHGKMSSSKNLIAGVSTSPGDPNTFAMHVFVRQIPGVIYSNADLENKPFAYHRIYSGGSHFWEIAQGSTNASRQISLTSKEDSAGPVSLPPANYTTISVDGGGIVSIGAEPTFSGVMSPDKKIIVGTSTDASGAFSLRIIQMKGQIYTQADLAGTHKAYAFHSDSVSSWSRATWVTNLTGNVTFEDFLGSDGGTGLPDPFTLFLDEQGNITSLEAAQHGGMLSFGKDLMVDLGDFLDGAYFVIKVQ